MTRARDLADSADKDISGTLTVDNIVMSNDMTVADDGKVIFGAGSDLQIYHDPSNNHSFIRESGTGDLRILGDNISFRSTSTDEPYINIATNGAVSLYYDNALKFATTSTGVNVDGSITIDANGTVGVNASNALQFTSSSHAVLNLGGSEILRATDAGNLLVGKTSQTGTGVGIEMQSDGTFYVGKTGDVATFNRTSSVDGSLIDFEKQGSTVGTIGNYGTRLRLGSASGAGFVFGGSQIYPATDGTIVDDTHDIGTASYRFKNIYLSGKSFADSYQFAQNSSATGASEAIYRATTGTIAIKTNSSERMRLNANGNLCLGRTSELQDFGDGRTSLVLQGTGSADYSTIQLGNYGTTNNDQALGTIAFYDGTNRNCQISGMRDDATNSGTIVFYVADTGTLAEAGRFSHNKAFVVGESSTGDVLNGSGAYIGSNGQLYASTNSSSGHFFNVVNDNQALLNFRHAGATEGYIDISGSTVTYNGFSGTHESSGIASNTAIGTVVSTIDELDTYAATQIGTDGIEDDPRAGQTRGDHAKIKVSDTEGDKRVYGVLQRFASTEKAIVTSVGIGSVRVTGACQGGDLLESNGDGTAKVQSDDIVKSKTIGKVTIGNSNTDVKLVSCVMYCG